MERIQRLPSFEAVAVLDLNAVSRLTGLGSMSPAAAIAMFGFHDTIDIEAFRAGFAERMETCGDVDRAKLLSTIDKLYALFDANGDGLVDFTELATGLSVLCGGSRDDKANATFLLYDTDGDGVISLDEMTRYLSSVFTIMFSQSTSTIEVNELAIETATQALLDAGAEAVLASHLTQDQFNTWFHQSVAIDAPPPPPPPPPRRSESTKASSSSSSSSSSPRSKSRPPPPPPPPKRNGDRRAMRRHSSLNEMGIDLRFVRRVTGLGSCTPEDVIEEFTEAASEDKTISLAAFTECFDNIVDVEQMTECDTSAFHMIIPGLYDLFDTDGDGTVDVTEIAAGISVLCGGAADDKARAVFDIYDANGDGVISLEEMQNYFSSVYRVGNMGARSVELLAKKTAIEAFNVADVNHDGTLTWDEFKNWYSSSGGGAEASF